MKKIFDLAFSLLILFYLSSCSTKPAESTSHILTDSASIANGKTKFTQNCSSCHNFKVDGIGPHLGGLTKDQNPEWIKEFIKDSQAKIDAGDKRAVELFNTFKTSMPPFGFLTDDELNSIIAFINTQETPDPRKSRRDPNALRDPIPDPIPMTDIVIELKEFAQVPASGEQNPRTRITKLTNQPGTNKLFVVDLRGKLYFLNGNKPEVYMDMAKEKPDFIHTPGLATGFGSYAFHPEFAKNGLLYTTHTEPAGTAKADFDYADSIKVAMQWVLSEWKTTTPGAIPFVGESRELMRIDMVSQIHGVQEIAFNPLAKPGDGDYAFLYMGIGDGGSAENGYPFLCTGNETIWSSVIRIDPKGNNSKNGKYGIPDNNPFAESDNPNVVKEIFAYGFRNPHRIIWDQSGRIFIPNIGHQNIESLYLIEAGSNCGWPIREGTFVIDPSQNMWNIYPRPADDAKNNFNYPVAEYDHDEGNAIAGGFEYNGKLLPELKGKFVFGDIVKGRMFYIDMEDIKPGTPSQIKEWRISFNGEITTLSTLCDSQKVDERFGMDITGELYLTTKPDGKIYRLVSSRVQK